MQAVPQQVQGRAVVEPPADILILHGGALGDFVLCAHVVAGVRGRFPQARLTVAARTPIARWFAGRGPFDEAYDVESLALHRMYSGDGFVPENNPLTGRDLIISFLGGSAAAMTQRLERSVAARVFAVDPGARVGADGAPRHITAQWVEDLRAAGLKLQSVSETQPLIRDGCGSGRKATPRSIRAICHPGSGGREKCAPLEGLEGIVLHLINRGLEVAWMIGPTERDWYGQPYVDRLARSARVIEEHDICSAADRLLGCDVFIGNDAGTTHLAAALGLRVVALFRSTDPAVWRPLGPRVHVVRLDQSGAWMHQADREAILQVVSG